MKSHYIDNAFLFIQTYVYTYTYIKNQSIQLTIEEKWNGYMRKSSKFS